MTTILYAKSSSFVQFTACIYQFYQGLNQRSTKIYDVISFGIFMERMHSIFDHVLRKIYYPPTMPHQRFNRHSPKKSYSLWRGMSNKILFIIHFSDYLECYFKYLQFSFRIATITIAAPSK